jgi:hypothetical protein
VDLSFSDFTTVLAMTGLAAWAARRLRGSPLTAPEQRLAAWLGYLGARALPGSGWLLSRAAGVLAGEGREGVCVVCCLWRKGSGGQAVS